MSGNTPGNVQFISNYTDHSTPNGFQFEFHCGRCRSGFRTPFKPSVTGGISQALDAASTIFGGLFGKAANVGDRLRTATWQSARDSALNEAIEQIKPDFAQCPKCQQWVCRAACWNAKRGLCKHCAPDLAVEMSAAQAAKAKEEVWTTSAIDADDKAQVESDRSGTVRALCPKCEAPLATNAKFCPNCGADLKKEAHCTQCGAKLAPGAKFCGDCGSKTAA